VPGVLVIATAVGVAVLLVLVGLVLLALCRDPDPVEPASLESGEPREAVRRVIERRR
jgi:hypothetical protein